MVNTLPQHILKTRIYIVWPTCISKAEPVQLEKTTREQSQSTLWWNSRQVRLTPSHFSGILETRPNGRCDKCVERMLKPAPRRKNMPGTLKYGHDTEKTATAKYQENLINLEKKVNIRD